MNADTLINIFSRHADSLITWGLTLLLLLAALFLILPAIKGWYRELVLRQKINSLAAESLHQVVLPDGMEGAVYLENLLLTPDGLLVLAIHGYRGVLFAADNIDNWTQVIGKRSYKFPNPLTQLESDVLAVRACVNNIPVTGRVLFTSGVEFPKGKPEKLISLTELENMRQQNQDKPVPATYLQAWEELKHRIRTPEVLALRKLYAVDRESHFSSQTVAGTVMLLLAAAWIGWRYMM